MNLWGVPKKLQFSVFCLALASIRLTSKKVVEGGDEKRCIYGTLDKTVQNFFLLCAVPEGCYYYTFPFLYQRLFILVKCRVAKFTFQILGLDYRHCDIASEIMILADNENLIAGL